MKEFAEHLKTDILLENAPMSQIFSAKLRNSHIVHSAVQMNQGHACARIRPLRSSQSPRWF